MNTFLCLLAAVAIGPPGEGEEPKRRLIPLSVRDAASINNKIGNRPELAKTVLTVTRQSREVGNECVARTGQAIEQRGFANVGSTDQRNDG